MSKFDLSIGDFVARTGIAEPTLRMWERRYGFPEPRRTDSGHRRYSHEQIRLVERVLTLRQSGLSLPVAIARVQAPPDPDAVSLFSTVRDLRPELAPRAVSKPVLIALSHAIEDEMLARAESLVMFACFQREGFYRASWSRWRELSSSARVAVVFADFAQAGEPQGAPAEVPISLRQQVAREWAIVLHGGRSSIAMVARELASSSVAAASRARSFELIWTVDPDTVTALSRACVVLLRAWLPELAERAERELEVDPAALPAEQVTLSNAVVNRLLAELS